MYVYFYYFVYFFNLCRYSGVASLIHNEDLHSTFPSVSNAFIRPTHVNVFNDFKLSLQTVVQLNGVIEEQTRLVSWERLCVEIYLLDSRPTLYYLETLLAHFRLQKAETVLGLAAIKFMSAENQD